MSLYKCKQVAIIEVKVCPNHIHMSVKIQLKLSIASLWYF